MPYCRGGQRLREAAERLGFRFLRTSRGGNHILMVHQHTAAIICVPLQVSEYGRNFANYRLALQRAAQITPRRPTPSTRPARPKRPTGEAIERAERIAARLENANHVRVCAAIERQDQRVRFYARLMSG